MPQLDPSTYVSQLFWLGLCFLALYLILSYWALPRISRTLEKRDKTITDYLNKASTSRERAEDLLAEYEKILQEARETAQAKSKSSVQAIQSDIETQKRQFLEKLNDRLRLSEQELYRNRVNVGKDITSLSKDIADMLLEKLTGEKFAEKNATAKRKKV